MSPTRDRHSGSLPPDALRDLHRRLAVVLFDVDFPAQRWQLIAGADLYGADTVTRSLIERAPEQRYQSLAELVAVLGAVLGGRPLAPVRTPTVVPRAAPSAPPPPGTRRPAPRSPRPAA